MKVQPLLLTTPTLLPGRIPGVGVQGARATESNTVGASSAVDTKDTLEISSEAESALAVQLSHEEQKQITELKKTDREVRAHEQAHLAAAGPFAKGGPTFEYEIGPDGNRYAVGGEVQIDTSPVPDDPEATIQKARVIRAAASAPSEPSAQDQAVAAQASQLEAAARKELLEQESTAQDVSTQEASSQQVGQTAETHKQISASSRATAESAPQVKAASQEAYRSEAERRTAGSLFDLFA